MEPTHPPLPEEAAAAATDSRSAPPGAGDGGRASPAASAGRASRARRVRRAGLVVLLVFGLLLGLVGGTLAWLLRPEALRLRAQAALTEAAGRPVVVREVAWAWQPASQGKAAQAQFVVKLRAVTVPALVASTEPLLRREVRIGQATVHLLAAPARWWGAWRRREAWPVVALQMNEVQSRQPGSTGTPDGLGDWQLQRVELAGIVAAPQAPRVLRVQARGTWQRLPALPALPLEVALSDLALTPGVPGSFSLDQAEVRVGALDARFSFLVVGQGEATFSVALKPVNLREALPPLGIPLPSTTDPMAFSRVAARGDCHFAADGAGCSSLELQLDATHLAGEAWRLAPPAGERWTLRLAADALDLDRYLPPENLEEPPTAVPWNLADAWPLELSLSVRDLRTAGLRLRKAELTLQAGEHGLVRQ